jgi:hypothetical protein
MHFHASLGWARVDDRCPTSRYRVAIIRQLNDYFENSPLGVYPSALARSELNAWRVESGEDIFRSE